MHYQDVRQRGELRHRRHVADRVEWQLRVQRRDDGVRRRHAEQGVAVRRGVGHQLDPDEGTRAGTIVHHHGLAEAVAHALRHDARDDVGGSARALRHDQSYRPRGIVLRRGADRPAPQRGGGQAERRVFWILH